jgi:hypothetical protein
VLYIGSSLEAIDEGTRMKALLTYFQSLRSPYLAAKRSYEIVPQPGVMPHFIAPNLSRCEEFLPVADVKVRIRAPLITVPRVLIHEAVLVELA